jgi:hypothetical protein
LLPQTAILITLQLNLFQYCTILMITHTHTHTHTHTLTLTHSYSHTPTHTRILTCSHTLAHAHFNSSENTDSLLWSWKLMLTRKCIVLLHSVIYSWNGLWNSLVIWNRRILIGSCLDLQIVYIHSDISTEYWSFSFVFVYYSDISRT